MTAVRIHLVRHGRAAAGWGDDRDPGLDEVGRAQATQVASELAELGPQSIVTSPMKRARETAAPLATHWDVIPTVEPAVGEIPSPTTDLEARGVWLRAALRKNWKDLDPPVVSWRSGLLATLLELPGDAVVFTHFVAINAVVSAAAGDKRLIVFAPANASVTVIDIESRHLSVVRLGGQADTQVT